MQTQPKHVAADVRLVAPLVVAIFVVTVAVAFVAPVADAELRRTSEYTATYSKEAVRGRAIYGSEGCWYCHSQSVRPVGNDVGLGGVTSAERVAGDRPPFSGLSRTGPDLACSGDRLTDAAALVEFLKDPRSIREGARMPSFGYLSDKQLSDLVTYLTGLRCAGG